MRTTKIEVLDSIMGSGKTTKIIDRIKGSDEDEKFIYVTPLLSECERVGGPLDGTYDNTHPLCHKLFKHPKIDYPKCTKMEGLLDLLKLGENITTTHALFQNLNPDHLKEIETHNYTLVIDECLSVIEDFKTLDGMSYSIEHINELMADGFISVSEKDGCTLQWNKEVAKAEASFYKRMRELCEIGSLLYINGKVLLWELPIEVIKAFHKITICTYKFKGSYMDCYLRFHDIDVDISYFGDQPSTYKDLITIVEDEKLNAVGKQDSAFSFSNSKDMGSLKAGKVKRNIYNFFTNKCKGAKAEEKLWTCFKDVANKFKGKGYTKNWLAKSTKATNEYADTKYLAYVCNIFANPFIEQRLNKKDIKVDQDLYAVSEMVQFLWRSQIRNGKPITVYVPSSRMRNLLKRWLNDEFEEN